MWSRRFAVFAMALAAMALLIARTGIADVPAVLAIFGAAILIAVIALLFAGAAAAIIWRTGMHGTGIAVTAVLLSFALLAWPAWLAVQAVRLPLLADVTTDINDPPQFSRTRKALEARRDVTPLSVALNLRQQQRSAYPGVQPILLELDAEEAWGLVLKAVIARGWKIIEQSAPGAGRGASVGHIDAVDRTLIMGFPDDVTIRVRPLAGQTKIDVRSVSRYGRNDFGVNAKRIEQFAQELQNQLDQR